MALQEIILGVPKVQINQITLVTSGGVSFKELPDQSFSLKGASLSPGWKDFPSLGRIEKIHIQFPADSLGNCDCLEIRDAELVKKKEKMEKNNITGVKFKLRWNKMNERWSTISEAVAQSAAMGGGVACSRSPLGVRVCPDHAIDYTV